ncbi:LacI family DNA-binding transcriptional regulator [Leeuwenhoekiella polynyae]|uniref:LacI family transcriptional regulator n=1 Tax=Leeuwenhoekiella polynyae TaxID=1550906 RepID=A0A4Q0NNU9_9FLAO|nr:LacI family DNA-binding transcriptional regulator [Leeuwenhoekiella polynyae]RXG11614.1 LacI family transcriptional regulator [Leeuwenhoekiella polynyae]
MKKKRPSLKDIADALNISTTTVSFVLNGKGEEKKISKELIAKVEAHLKEINYKPNLVARSLRTGSTRVLVFMVEDISNSHFSKVGRIIEDISYKNDYRVLFCSTENDVKRTQDLIHLFHERQVDGFIIVPPPGIEKEISYLLENEVPVVLFDRKIPELEADYVIINNFEGAKQSTQHLIDSGYKNIAFITIDLDQIQMHDREAGYIAAIEEAGFSPNILKIPYDTSNIPSSREKIKKFIKESKDIDAIFFATNYLSQSGLKCIHQIDAKLINKLGIISFDDSNFFEMYSPTVSAFAQPVDEMANQLMKIMFNKLKNKEQAVSSKLVLEGTLVTRESSLKK